MTFFAFHYTFTKMSSDNAFVPGFFAFDHAMMEKCPRYENVIILPIFHRQIHIVRHFLFPSVLCSKEDSIIVFARTDFVLYILELLKFHVVSFSEVLENTFQHSLFLFSHLNLLFCRFQLGFLHSEITFRPPEPVEECVRRPGIFQHVRHGISDSNIFGISRFITKIGSCLTRKRIRGIFKMNLMLDFQLFHSSLVYFKKWVVRKWIHKMSKCPIGQSRI